MTDPKTVAAIREAAETAAVCDFSHRCGKKWPTSPAYWCVGCLLAGQSAALDALQREVEQLRGELDAAEQHVKILRENGDEATTKLRSEVEQLKAERDMWKARAEEDLREWEAAIIRAEQAEAQLATAREALEKLGWMETAQEALAALAPAPKQED